MRTLRSLALLLAAGLLAAGTASADPVPLGSMDYSLSMGDTPIWGPVVAGTPSTTEKNVFTFTDGSWTGGGTTLSWQDVSVDIDPGVSGVWSITNNTAFTQVYTLTVDLPVLPVAPSSLMFGSSTISVADANFDGSATLASVGGAAVYNGRIDLGAVPAAALFSPVYSLVAPPGGTIGDTKTFGVFPGSVPGPAVAGLIGIQHVFSLTAGDTATFNSTFHLVAVPEPTTWMLALSGLLGLGLLGRRRS